MTDDAKGELIGVLPDIERAQIIADRLRDAFARDPQTGDLADVFGVMVNFALSAGGVSPQDYGSEMFRRASNVAGRGTPAYLALVKQWFDFASKTSTTEAVAQVRERFDALATQNTASPE